MKACLAAGIHVDVNFRDNRFYESPLYIAIEHNNDDCVEFLLKSGAEIYDEVLQIAGEKGSERCVNLILEAGGSFGKILCEAICRKRLDILERLIKAGADVNKYGSLVYATSLGSLEGVNFFLEAGANVNSITDQFQFEYHDLHRRTPLCAVARSDKVECLYILLKAGADVNMHDGYGYTALFGAADKGSVKSLIQLLKAGADVNLKNAWGSAALIGAAGSGSAKCLAALLNAGADVNLSSSALIYAVYSDSTECVDLLIKAEVDVNIQDVHHRSTALIDAVNNNSIQFVALLLEAGADVNIRDKGHKTALFGAASKDLTQCICEQGRSAYRPIMNVS